MSAVLSRELCAVQPDRQQTVVFTMTCPSKESADALAKPMKRDPQQFAHLRVKFALDDQVRNNVYVFSINTAPAEEDSVLALKILLRKIDCKLLGTRHPSAAPRKLNGRQRLAWKVIIKVIDTSC